MTNLNQKMNTVLTALNERLAERSELLRDMAVALLTGSNLFILGQNGRPNRRPSACLPIA